MTAIVPVYINGQQYNGNVEYTTSDVAASFSSNLQVFIDIFGLTPNSGTIQDQVTSGNYASSVYSSIQNLLSLASNGMNTVYGQTATSPGTTVTYYLTDQMAQSLDIIFRTLNAAGITNANGVLTVPAPDATAPDSSPSSIASWNQLILQWKTLVQSSTVVENALAQAVNAVKGNRSFQSLVELVYVSTGSEIVASNLSSLEAALSSTKDTLNSLTTFQNLHNNIVANDRSLANAATVKNTFASTGDANFGSIKLSLPPSLKSANASGVVQFLTNISQVRDAFITQISYLQGVTPTLANGQQDPNSLLANLKTLVSNLNSLSGFFRLSGTVHVPLSTASLIANKTIAFNGMKTWLMDGYNSNTSTSGTIQNNINTAVTAASSLNDENKENVRRYLYVFEQYYKSASAILTSITQIIQKMAQHAGGG